MNLGGNLDVNLGGKTHNFATGLLNLLNRPQTFVASEPVSYPALLCFVVSCAAISCPANWSVNFTSVIFTSSIFCVRHLHAQGQYRRTVDTVADIDG